VIRWQPAAIRAAVFAWLEEIRFRTGMAVLIAAVAIAGGAATAAIVTSQGGRAARPAASLAGQIPVALPQTASAAPSSGPVRAHPRPGAGRSTARHVSHRAAGVPAAGVPAVAAQPASGLAQPARHGRGHRHFPGWWWRQAWEQHGHGGWPQHPPWRTPRGWPAPPGGRPGWGYDGGTGD
jgi:hypothetical protein